MYNRYLKIFLSILCFLNLTGCQRSIFQSPTVSPTTMRDVPAQRLNFRFEADVPPPEIKETAQIEERNAAIQNDFDQNRPQQILAKTITSPNKQRVLAVYQRIEDNPLQFRLDMFAPDGRLIRKITPDGMAVHFPDTIVWSPDSGTVAFVATVRTSAEEATMPGATPNPDANANTAQDSEIDTETDTNTENTETNTAPPQATPAAEEPKPVLTFRTDQIYLVNSEGVDLKPVTQNEGLIYFYYAWSPDSSALAALAATFREWEYLKYQAGLKQEAFLPMGRPRVVEKTGRERRLDDNLTKVRPEWSPDSAKVAVAFDKQIRIYDAIGETPTQAAIQLRNELLISSKKYDEELIRKDQGDANTQINGANTAANRTVSTLPDESTLVSFNPIIYLEWAQDNMLYLQTGYIKEMQNPADSARSYLRWHRLILSPQAVALGN